MPTHSTKPASELIGRWLMGGRSGPKEASDDHSRNRADDCCVAQGLANEGSPPLATAVGIGFLMGAAVGAAGGTMDNVMPSFLLPELACLGALIVMANRRPANARVPAGIEASAFSDTSGVARLRLS